LADLGIVVSLHPSSAGHSFCLEIALSRPSTGEGLRGLWDARAPCDFRLGATETWEPDLADLRDPVIVAEQGIGDFIQYWRYLSTVAAEFPTARLECRRELWRLADAQPSPMPLLPPGATAGDPGVERISMMRLDGFYPDPTAGRPYMTMGGPPAPPRSLGRRARVGLNWAGSPRGIGAAGKSLPLPVLGDLIGAHPGIDWVSIQFGDAEALLDEHSWAAPVERRGRALNDVHDLAATIAGLDLLITIDSAPAHMAGALGVPTWMLLNSPTGWRWGLGTDTTPLYETVRLVRQPKPGDWLGVLETVSARLEGVSADIGAALPAFMPSVPRRLQAAAAVTSLSEGIEICCAADDHRSTFVISPLPLLDELGVPPGPHDSAALAEVFAAIARCYGGFPWGSPLE
jgi:hypothetical protein